MAKRQILLHRDRQPQEAVELDTAGEFYNNLVVAAPFNPALPLLDMVGNRPITPTGLDGRAVTQTGAYKLFGSSNYADLQLPPEITTGTQPVTIAWTQLPIGSSGYGTILSWKVPGATSGFIIYQSVSDSSYYFCAGPRNGGNVGTLWGSIGPTTDGVLDQFLLVCGGGVNSQIASDYVLYRNGASLASTGATAFSSSSVAAFRVGALDGGGGDPFEGAIGDFCIWNEAFDDSKARRYQSHQWSLYAPKSILVPAVSAGVAFIAAQLRPLSQAVRNAGTW